MDARPSVHIEITPAMAGVEKAAWDGLANPPGQPFNPFISWDFLEALEASGCVAPDTGWAARHILARDRSGALVGAAPAYLKSHSYGEYVFDHSWADALHRAGGRYYPKLQIAAPFTPVPGPRLLAGSVDVQAALLAGAAAFATQCNASSVHATFTTEAEAALGPSCEYLHRTGVQFHWENDGYTDFTDFLAALSSNKRKSIRKERQRALDGLHVRIAEGDGITPADWDFFFECYTHTGARKWGRPYLNRAFFTLLAERMGGACVLFIAETPRGQRIASALNLKGSDTLYGRYWGALADVPFLHFELCYYQAIDYALAHGLRRCEAGAQGEHKLLRGYAPVATHSLHWIAHSGLRQAIKSFLAAETPAIAEEIEQLESHTPFKKDQ
jgi:predicted N-acyltransferase